MTAAGICWLVAGVLAGALHAFSLWRAARPPFRWVAAAPLRLVAVAGVLVAAALNGELWPAVGGWTCGFPLTAAVLYFRRTA